MSNAQGSQIRTPEQALAELKGRGETIAAFARRHALPYATVYQVLHKQKKGVYGEAHRAAVLLGLKAGVITPEGGAQ
ncbi:DNA-binding protein [Lysobacter enzymogenes]|uniref:DNA-binding protein n=1 Tax=Lysobacter enzymogenes TaxID=69 RepID=UPI00384C1B41